MASEKESQNSQVHETHSIPTDYDKKQDKKLIRKVDFR